jgi:ABC-type transport system involved in multi-copper enzyme maturation permease subunit
MPTWTLALKDLRLLARDRRAVVILLAMPLLVILVLGMALGETFGQKPDDRLRVSVVDEDRGPPADGGPFPGEPWSHVVRRDLEQTAGIRVEVIPDRPTAERLVRTGRRSCVLVFGPDFSARVHRCSFLADRFLKQPGLNPFYRDGVSLDALNVEALRDPTQAVAASIIEQVAQVTLLRVVLPWMIGRAFEEVGRQLPLAAPVIQRLFSKYDLTAKTWAALTRSGSREPSPGEDGQAAVYREEAGGLLNRGAQRYQILVPSYTVMFAFFLVLTAGWLFVAERRQGTMLRLRAAPLTRGQILLGKLIPCFALSLVQGFFLLAAGRLVFGMSWGTHPLALVPVVVCTSAAATGLALLVASLARTETQVAVYGTLLVVVLAGASGCLMPRDLMPEEMRQLSLVTPHAWSLDAYSQLLLNPQPVWPVVAQACLALLGFAAAFTALAWWRLRLE